jgi:hypothetical protein
MVLTCDQIPAGNRSEALGNAGVGDRLGVGGPLGDGKDGRDGRVEVGGERRTELRRVEADLRTTGDLGRDQRQRRCRPRRELADGLARGRDESGDVDERLDVGDGGGRVGDDGATVRVTDQDLRTVDGGQVAGDVGGVGGQSLQRIGERADGIAVAAQPVDDGRPAAATARREKR